MATRRPAMQDSTYGYVRDMDTGDVLDVVGQIAMNTNRITGLGDPVSAQDAATKAYVDAVASGLDVKQSVRVLPTADLSAFVAAGSGVGATLTSPDDSTSHNTQDGVALAVGNRVLVATAGGSVTTPDADNGIYVVTTLADGAGQGLVLTRATDFDQNAEVTAGAFTFVAEGTANGDTGWVLVTNDTITVDTTALQFSQFSTTTSYTFGKGLMLSGANVDVELDTSANAQGAGNGGGSSGLEFDAAGAGGKLRAAVHATGGLERTASGLAAKLNGNSLVSGASGLSVGHAPKDQNVFQSAEALTAGDAVTFSTTGDQVYQARGNNDARSFAIGIAMNTVAGSGLDVTVVTHGPALGVLGGSATPGAHYYVGATGGLTTTLPTGGNRRRLVGYAINANDLFVNVEDRGRSAA